MADIKITPGVIFDTPFETGCVALTEPDADGNFEGRDSDGVACDFTLAMVSHVYPGPEIKAVQMEWMDHPDVPDSRKQLGYIGGTLVATVWQRLTWECQMEISPLPMELLRRKNVPFESAEDAKATAQSIMDDYVTFLVTGKESK